MVLPLNHSELKISIGTIAICLFLLYTTCYSLFRCRAIFFQNKKKRGMNTKRAPEGVVRAATLYTVWIYRGGVMHYIIWFTIYETGENVCVWCKCRCKRAIIGDWITICYGFTEEKYRTTTIRFIYI